MKKGILHDMLLNGQHCVTFVECEGDTETRTFRCFPTKHKALLEIGIFEYGDIYRKLAKV